MKTTKAIIISYKIIGITILTLMISIASCRKDGSKRSVPVEEETTPIIDFTWTGGQTAPATLDFTNNTQNATSYRWDMGNGQISTLRTPQKITYTNAGNYDVILLATNGNKQALLKKTIVITNNVDPAAHFSYTFKDKKNFVPAHVNFYNESVNANAYEWNINGTLYYSIAPSNIVFNQPGDYKITLTAIKNGVRSAPYEEMITVVADSNNPTASFVLAYHPYPYVAGAYIQFVNRSLNADSWEWDFGNNSQVKSTQEHPLVKFEASGTYTITLIAKKNGVASAPKTINLKIN